MDNSDNKTDLGPEKPIMDYPKLKNPPVREAAFDLRYVPATQPTIDKIRSFHQQFSTDFPETNEMFIVGFEAKIGQDLQHAKRIQSNRTSNGFRMSNKDKSFVLQLRTDGFTFSKVSPYISWEEIKEEVTPILDKFFSFFKDVQITRIGLRYINEFPIKFDKQPSAYFNILPSYPAHVLPNTVERFSIHLGIPRKEDELQSRIGLSIEPTKVEDTYRTIFDIDIFKVAIYDSVTFDKMMSDFEKIRDFKNLIFFNALTPELLETFN